MLEIIIGINLIPIIILYVLRELIYVLTRYLFKPSCQSRLLRWC